MWADKYIGIKYKEYGADFSGCDCWGLVKLVFKHELKIDLADHMCKSYHADTQKALFDEAAHWSLIENIPIPFDIIAFKYGGIIGHVGIVIDKSTFLHVQDKIMSCTENYLQTSYLKRIAGVYRYDCTNY